MKLNREDVLLCLIQWQHLLETDSYTTQTEQNRTHDARGDQLAGGGGRRKGGRLVGEGMGGEGGL